MMKRYLQNIIFLMMSGIFCMIFGIPSAQAFTPSSSGNVISSPVNGPLSAGGEAGTNYIAFGVDFSYGGIEGVFSDPPLAFGGVNSSGIVDLLAPVDGRIVEPGTINQGVTNYFYAEAGFADSGTLLLSVYDLSHNLIGSAFNDIPLGANGRTTFEINTPGIAYFEITNPGNDSFGVDEILLSPVPEPEIYAMLLAGLGLLGLMIRRRKQAAI